MCSLGCCGWRTASFTQCVQMNMHTDYLVIWCNMVLCRQMSVSLDHKMYNLDQTWFWKLWSLETEFYCLKKQWLTLTPLGCNSRKDSTFLRQIFTHGNISVLVKDHLDQDPECHHWRNVLLLLLLLITSKATAHIDTNPNPGQREK